jgi:hypothetical protein
MHLFLNLTNIHYIFSCLLLDNVYWYAMYLFYLGYSVIVLAAVVEAKKSVLLVPNAFSV